LDHSNGNFEGDPAGIPVVNRLAAGAAMILTYYAKRAAEWLKDL
jgi:hypothetical protein